MNWNFCYPEYFQELGGEHQNVGVQTIQSQVSSRLGNRKGSAAYLKLRNTKHNKISLKSKINPSGYPSTTTKLQVRYPMEAPHHYFLSNKPPNTDFNHPINNHYCPIQPPKPNIVKPQTTLHFYYRNQQPQYRPISSMPKIISAQFSYNNPNNSNNNNNNNNNNNPNNNNNNPNNNNNNNLQQQTIPSITNNFSQRQQIMNSYCNNLTTVPSQKYIPTTTIAIIQKDPDNKQTDKNQDEQIYKIKVTNTNIEQATKTKNCNQDDISKLNQINFQSDDRLKNIIKSNCQIRQKSRQQDGNQSKKRGYMAQSHKELREFRHPSMDFLQCKRTQSLASSQQSQNSIVVMSHYDLISRNLFDEGPQASKDSLDDLQQGIQNNVYVGKTQLLSRQSHL